MENLKQFLAICFFKNKEPDTLENTSFSSALLFYSVVALSIQINFHGALVASIATCLEILSTLVFLGILVLYNKMIEEFHPLCCAVFVCTGFIAGLGMPFTLMLYIIKGKWALFIYYSIVGLVIWNIILIRHLFQKILIINSIPSLLLAVAYFVISYVMPFLLVMIL
jgi:hypothetical protein